MAARTPTRGLRMRAGLASGLAWRTARSVSSVPAIRPATKTRQQQEGLQRGQPRRGLTEMPPSPSDVQRYVLRRIRQTRVIEVPGGVQGAELVNSPLYNKGTGFFQRERDRLRLRGLVPPVYFDIDDQVGRVYGAFHRAGRTDEKSKKLGLEEDVIAKYLFLVALQDRNETLFYKLVTDNIEEMAPIIYTPTVGYACQNASTLFRRPRGMFFSVADRGDFHAMIQNWPRNDVEVVVVTDGSRILGLGDLGLQGMAIPIGKLSLYVAAGGIHPSKCMPCIIDVGTNNQELLDSEEYMGVRQKRAEGDAYLSIMDEFMIAVQGRFPDALIQFEDFKTPNAELLLKRYQNFFTCFNDDVQGTGAVALGGLLAATRKTGKQLEDLKIVCVGAGSAGIGVCEAIANGMVMCGKTGEEAAGQFWVLDKDGLLTTARGSALQIGQQGFARADEADREGETLLETVRRVKPDILLGLSGVGSLFTEEVLRSMAADHPEPIIFALSNPTHLSECTAEEAYRWTDGRCVFACGSPFQPVTMTTADGVERTCTPSQGNNMFIFPGLGLGIVGSKATTVVDEMLFEAAQALASCVTQEQLDQGNVFPDISDIRMVSRKVAKAVALVAEKRGLSRDRPRDGNWAGYLEDFQWTPEYYSLVTSSRHGRQTS